MGARTMALNSRRGASSLSPRISDVDKSVAVADPKHRYSIKAGFGETPLSRKKTR